jgi:hypothetical protein
MHADLSQFTTTFSAQSVLHEIQDLHDEFTASVADDATQATVLRNIWFEQAASIDVELSDEQRFVLRNDYAFGYDEPVLVFTPR